MNAKTLARHYDRLTAEERFRLILAASGRGDDAERTRLVRAARRITLTAPDHSPYAHAFDELALLIFIELLEDAARFLDAFDRANDALDRSVAQHAEEDGGAEEEQDEAETGERADEGPTAEAGAAPYWVRLLELSYAAGYVLRTKAHAWERFCQRLDAAPFLLCEGLPGYDRLRRALALAEKAAYAPEGMLRWLNARRPAGEPELTAIPLTAEGLADATTQMYQERVTWWGG